MSKGFPTRLQHSEIHAIKDMVTDEKYQHISIPSLALLGARKKIVTAFITTWHRIIKKFNLMRPGKRVYPLKPKVGIRANFPNQIWHMDLSVIKLTDSTRCYIRAIIDNFSRYVIACSVSTEYGGRKTKELLISAIEKAKSMGMTNSPDLYVDGGSENQNADVNDVIGGNNIQRFIAQIDVDFSNSMIEASGRFTAFLIDSRPFVVLFAVWICMFVSHPAAQRAQKAETRLILGQSFFFASMGSILSPNISRLSDQPYGYLMLLINVPGKAGTYHGLINSPRKGLDVFLRNC